MIFNVIFTLEAAIKIVGFGFNYFKSSWNLFDLFIVLGTYAGIFLLQIFGVNLGPVSTILKTFRIGRMLRLFRRNKSLKTIFHTFIVTLPALGNVGFLLMLFLFIYALLGVNLFAPVKLNGAYDTHANF